MRVNSGEKGATRKRVRVRNGGRAFHSYWNEVLPGFLRFKAGFRAAGRGLPRDPPIKGRGIGAQIGNHAPANDGATVGPDDAPMMPPMLPPMLPPLLR